MYFYTQSLILVPDGLVPDGLKMYRNSCWAHIQRMPYLVSEDKKLLLTVS